MYIETRSQLGNGITEIRRHEGLLGAPGKLRFGKRKRTTKQGKEQNRRARARHIQRLLLTNFRPGDLHVVLEYRKEERPESYEAAKDRIRAFIRRIRRYYKERGHALKYIAITEKGKRRAVLHHHIVIEAIDDRALHTLPAISQCWEGYVRASVLYPDGEFEQLAEYLAKAAGKEDCAGATYMRSRNLKEPVTEKRVVFGRIPEEPKAPDGFEIIKTSVRTGRNPHTGKTHQRYLMREIEKTAKTTEKRMESTNQKRKPTIFEKIAKTVRKLWRR